jgi:hypothetical protein
MPEQEQEDAGAGIRHEQVASDSTVSEGVSRKGGDFLMRSYKLDSESSSSASTWEEYGDMAFAMSHGAAVYLSASRYDHCSSKVEQGCGFVSMGRAAYAKKATLSAASNVVKLGAKLQKKLGVKAKAHIDKL